MTIRTVLPSVLQVLLLTVFLPALSTFAIGAEPALNRLAYEKSPYLRQHAANPVNWYPWGSDAFEKARRENKPIFLSVGYSTCHWCHVMERESFMNPAIAAELNANFVCIKVDREERPDVDRLYMAFVLQSTGRGGWPMSVWLTPELKPFLGGVYFPPVKRDGLPGFKDVLGTVAHRWATEREQVVAHSNELLASLASAGKPKAAAHSTPGTSIEELRESGFAQASRSFNRRYGGFGGAPKFPHAVAFEFLLDVAGTSREPAQRKRALEMTLKTLREIADGGIHDQLGGGFHRYTVDARWRVPHFEKMLYDQAQLVNVYLSAWQLSGDETLRPPVIDTLRYVTECLTAPDGGFYSADDADSLEDQHATEKREGAFYTWTASAIVELLGNEEGAVFNMIHGVEPRGNTGADPGEELAGQNVLYRAHSNADAAKKFKRSPASVASLMAEAKTKMALARAQRPRPARDDKIVTAWNGLMISAFARAAQVLDEPGYAADAERAAQFLEQSLYDASTGRLSRSFRAGVRDDHGFAEDYACLIQGLLDLYEATFSVRWLAWAIQLQEKQIELFADKTHGGFFANAAGDTSVLLRLKEDNEGAEPAASSISVKNLSRLAAMLQRDEWRILARDTVRAFTAQLARDPLTMPQMLAAMGFLEEPPSSILIHGERNSSSVLVKEAWKHFRPRHSLVRIDRESRRFFAGRMDIVRELPADDDNVATGYVCDNFVCQLPTSDPDVFARQLTGATSIKAKR